ncbi:hypothetical protein PHYBLDRAFT_156967 [Phycomyces blakesleeanus NRRL 1555(-)]|uniref:Uncharacterized protein n=1 Tax=Phycomyces blakesleeanus (strain ATCC 8743b / DSM 1359 / FGSC 10004 / NBRC 33097 / NRRL 1555) TaxID=763407 RepID=A0A162Q7E3_PHYB8|nr:hypothetical protein PHYBLDRAFT_156967 [Phycomyces blakesleeanus NRRL 1555(-)]OAD80736.1 hypothetical protein PHYBLDRAFT_156967 [Phycomyces blakesleeanus NRRL 1555(-)]|eukprot:XP_018298776.1 hypothetical protein PHYBLDRAFT_156967 [Phycomyces blakesleeanus NRRL 1555(-)]
MAAYINIWLPDLRSPPVNGQLSLKQCEVSECLVCGTFLRCDHVRFISNCSIRSGS